MESAFKASVNKNSIRNANLPIAFLFAEALFGFGLPVQGYSSDPFKIFARVYILWRARLTLPYSSLPNFVEWFIAKNSKSTGRTVTKLCISLKYRNFVILV